MKLFRYHAGGDPLALRRSAGHWAAPARDASDFGMPAIQLVHKMGELIGAEVLV